MADLLARRATLLQDLTLEVGRAPDAKAAAGAVVRLGRELLAAVSSIIWLLDAEGALEVVASDGIPASFVERWQRVLPSDDLPAVHAIRLGEPLWISSPEQYQERLPEIAEAARAANRPMAFAALPLRFEQRALGVIVFGYPAPHVFSEEEKALALAVAGHAAHVFERARLQEAQVRALAGLRVIARAGEMVAASLDVNATLTALAQAVVPDVADWCAVDMFADGNVRRLVAHHADPDKVAVARAYAERYPSRLDDETSSMARMFADGQPVWVRRITSEMLTHSIADKEQLAVLLSLGLRSTVQVPLVSEGIVRGAVTFIMSESRREYDEIDRDLLVEIGRRAGQALTNASLYAREQRARDRIGRIARVTAELARASTTAEVGDVACREGAAALGAGMATLYAVEGDHLRLVSQFNNRPSYAEHFGRIPLVVDTPVGRAIIRNESVVIQSRAELEREFPSVAAGVREATTAQSFICKPLAGRGGIVVGALGFGFVAPRTFDEDERVFARTLADHCAQAFDRARILDLERSTSDRLALLAAAGETFSATIDYEATLQAVVRIALPTLGDFGFFDIVEESGNVRRSSAAHDDPVVAAILAGSQWTRSERTDVNLCALSTGASALHSSIDEPFLKDMATSEGHLAVLRALKLCSMITVPVTMRGSVVGALTLCFGRSGRRHTREDHDLAMELARRGAIAVEQARLYRASADAARRAEEANRMKDDFLATVSHELRTPLNAILGWARLLEGERLGDPAFVERGVQVIRRNADAQRELIDDILDVSRIISGKLRIDPTAVEVEGVVRDAMEVVRPAADAKRIRLASDVLDGAATVLGDRARLQQVVWNLLANAVKFTPAGGKVQTTVASTADAVTVRVTDEGIGIDAELLPFVFDRFRQGDGSTTRAHGGLGLGLSIVRHIVELHGGTVRAESGGRGKGATFEVTLPGSAVVRALLRSETPPPPGLPSSAPGASLEGIRVLLVDDDQDSREVVAFMLADAGATLSTSESAEQAVSLFERGAFDVVVSDISMPRVDGFALLAALKNIAKERALPLRAIALTAHGRPDDRAATARAGFQAHLTKPVDRDTLLATVARLGRS